ncbi:MAG: hypothetical protein WDX04_15060, partial [Klebsiella michiganensis]
GQMRQAVASMPLRRTALKRVKEKDQGKRAAGPRKTSKPRPGNSTGDGFKTPKTDKRKNS